MGFGVASGSIWKGGKVFYRLDKDMSKILRTMLKETMKRWEMLTDNVIEFLDLRKTENNKKYVNIIEDPYFSGLKGGNGMQENTQTLFISEDRIAGLPHELGHLIGLAHEHERDDSSLNPINVDKFKDLIRYVALSRQKHVKYGNYDVKSIMHYSSRYLLGWKWDDGVDDCPILIDRESIINCTWTPSPGDIETIRSMYEGTLISAVLDDKLYDKYNSK